MRLYLCDEQPYLVLLKLLLVLLYLELLLYQLYPRFFKLKSTLHGNFGFVLLIDYEHQKRRNRNHNIVQTDL